MYYIIMYISHLVGAYLKGTINPSLRFTAPFELHIY